MNRSELIEQLAGKEHERWSKWMKYLFSKSELLKDGSIRIPVDLVYHWEREIKTSYKDLPEQYKQSDREQVYSVLPIIQLFIKGENMLNEEEWNEVERIVDMEYMSQVQDSDYESVLMGVKLALSIVRGQDDTQSLAVEYLERFSNIRHIRVPRAIKRKLYVMNYGEEEVQAMEGEGQIDYGE